MGFINNNIPPLKFLQGTHAYSNTFKSGYADIKFARLQLVLKNRFSAFFPSYQVAHLNLRTPLSEFVHPVANYRFWHDYQMIALNLLKFSEKANQRNSLNSFSEAHLISQNSIDSGFIQTYHPIEAIQLVVSQLSCLENRGLLRKSSQVAFIFIV